MPYDKKYSSEELDLLHKELYEILGVTIQICTTHQIPDYKLLQKIQ